MNGLESTIVGFGVIWCLVVGPVWLIRGFSQLMESQYVKISVRRILVSWLVGLSPVVGWLVSHGHERPLISNVEPWLWCAGASIIGYYMFDAVQFVDKKEES